LSRYYIFNIYETTIETFPKNLFADNQSVIKISINPVNAFGWIIPYRKISGSFEITEGRDLVDIIKEDDRTGVICLRARLRTGKVVVKVISNYSFLPSIVEISIFPNNA
jgi:hypothetical protein